MDFGLSRGPGPAQGHDPPLARRASARRRACAPSWRATTGHDPALWRGLAELGVTGTAGARRRTAARGSSCSTSRWRPRSSAGRCTPGPFLGSAMATVALARERRRRGAAPLAARHRRRARRSPPSRSARAAASGTRRSSRRAPTAATLTGREAAGAVRATSPTSSSWRRRTATGPGLWLVERGAPGLDDRRRSRAPT